MLDRDGNATLNLEMQLPNQPCLMTSKHLVVVLLLLSKSMHVK